MKPMIALDQKSKTPAYRQIIHQITSLIRAGQLNPGDKLPTERDLAARLKIARGTIKKAYETLARDQVIEVTQGRGSFVSSRQDILPSGRKERAVALIARMLQELEDLKFSSREIRTLVDLKIIEREERMDNFHVAAVDCNPESLAIFERQLGHFAQVKLTRFLLDDLKSDPAPESRLKHFEVVLTTSTHYSEIIGMLPTLKDRLIQVAVSPSQETIIEMAGLNSSHRMGIICESANFLRIVKNKLKSLEMLPSTLLHLYTRDELDIPAFLEDLDVVFVPPGYILQGRRENISAVQNFAGRGGKVIPFDYQIERGSLLHVEERMRQLLNR